jgi:methionyl-tRNA formyltransferase
MDAGDILSQERIVLTGKETTASLSEAVAVLTASMLRDLFPALATGSVEARPQQGTPIYCSLIKKEQASLDWNLRAEEIDASVRAYNPWPLCYTHWNGEELYIIEGKKVTDTVWGVGSREWGVGQSQKKVISDSIESVPGLVTGTGGYGILIQTGDGVYAVSRLQRKAKKALDWKTFLNGAQGFIGSRLGQEPESVD